MLLSALVTRVLEEVGSGWTRARALTLLNDVQNEILGTDNQLMRIKPDPYLVTTDSVYTYNASSKIGGGSYEIRTVKDIYTLSQLNTFATLNLTTSSTRPYRSEHTRDGYTTHAVYDCIDSIRPSAEASDSSKDCSIRWWADNNPGATTTTWRCRAYIWPTQLTAETVAISIPSEFHEPLFLFGALMRTERREFGRDDYTRQAYNAALSRFKTKYSDMVTVGKESHVYPEIC